LTSGFRRNINRCRRLKSCVGTAGIAKRHSEKGPVVLVNKSLIGNQRSDPMTIDERISAKKAELEEPEKEKERREKRYPYVGRFSRSSFLFVLFTGPCKGAAILSSVGNLGEERTDWTEEDYHPFTGTIRYEDGQTVETREEA
jgi:hypothetical protein